MAVRGHLGGTLVMLRPGAQHLQPEKLLLLGCELAVGQDPGRMQFRELLDLVRSADDRSSHRGNARLRARQVLAGVRQAPFACGRLSHGV